MYSVNILYFDLEQGKDYIYRGSTHFIGIYQNDELGLSNKQRELYQKEQIHQIYTEYYLLKVNQFNDVAKDTLDEWIYFLKNEEIKIETAKKMKQAGISPELIREITGIGIDEI